MTLIELSLSTLCRQFYIKELEQSRDFYNNQNRLLKLLFALYNLLAANSELVCYLIIVLNNVVSASVISLVLPILVFLWAMLSVPRPTKKFWMTAIVYTEVCTHQLTFLLDVNFNRSQMKMSLTHSVFLKAPLTQQQKEVQGCIFRDSFRWGISHYNIACLI